MKNVWFVSLSWQTCNFHSHSGIAWLALLWHGGGKGYPINTPSPQLLPSAKILFQCSTIWTNLAYYLLSSCANFAYIRAKDNYANKETIKLSTLTYLCIFLSEYYTEIISFYYTERARNLWINYFTQKHVRCAYSYSFFLPTRKMDVLMAHEITNLFGKYFVSIGKISWLKELRKSWKSCKYL